MEKGRRRQQWIPGRGLQVGSAPRGFTFIENKARVRGLNPVFNHIFLSVTSKMSPRVLRILKWDLSAPPGQAIA